MALLAATAMTHPRTVATLRGRGLAARRLAAGYPEWARAGRPVA